mmetsp:Transcript_21397/g.37545  ORF Transcript_21397/g.37545 Transcript_21397/m.37545 type:complete len:165 (+) Transcript_21397:2-496(+)
MARWSKNLEAVWDKTQVLENITSRVALHVDARPAPRFHGEAPEPRPGLRLGHVPGSRSLPVGAVLAPGAPGRTLASRDAISAAAEAAGLTDATLRAAEAPRILTSCGSGLTACVVGLALHQIGMPMGRWTVYDGSWTEWGGLEDTPVMRRAADGGEEPVGPLQK